jgi:Tat protein secretion system quality control protein TatD with DNase activity
LLVLAQEVVVEQLPHHSLLVETDNGFLAIILLVDKLLL